MFITAFTNARHLSLSWASSIESISPHPTSWRSILILSHLCLGLPSGLFRFPHQNPAYTSPVPRMRYMPRPSHSSRFHHQYNIVWAVHIIQLLIMHLPLLPCYLIPPRPKYSPQHHFSNTLSLRSSLNVSDHVSYPYKTTGKIIVLYNLHV